MEMSQLSVSEKRRIERKETNTRPSTAAALDIERDSSHLTQFACRTLASSAGAYSQASPQHMYAEVTLNCSTKHVRHKTFLGTKPFCQRRFCSAKNTANDQTIDEFRAREEKREEEFEQERAKREEESERNAKVEAIRAKILEAALPHVPTLGWTRNAIVQGAEEAGYSSVAHGMFPEGGFALVSYFNGKCNEQLLEAMQKYTDNGTKDISNPIEFLVRFVRMRLEYIVPYKGQWAQALALIALIPNASTALAQVLTVVDDICYYSGDRSVDVGWYTRRIGLASIYKMTELYMLQDTSPDHCKTWEFLQNRMDEAGQLQMLLQSTEDVTSKFHRSFNSAFVTARNILGLDYNRP